MSRSPVGEAVGGGVRRRPDAPAPHVPSPKPTPGSIDRQGGTSRGGLGAPKYGSSKSMRLGGGGRFAAFVSKLEAQGRSVESAKAIAASAGRKKYGNAKMASWAAKGRK